MVGPYQELERVARPGRGVMRGRGGGRGDQGREMWRARVRRRGSRSEWRERYSQVPQMATAMPARAATPGEVRSSVSEVPSRSREGGREGVGKASISAR